MQLASIKEENHSLDQAKAQLESIIEMVKALNLAIENDNDEEREAAEQTIQEDALSVEVRSEWYTPGSDAGQKLEASEYQILLCTGGPAVRIIGDLGRYGQPKTARIEHQDWGTPWADLRLTSEEESIVLTYASQFYYGE